MRSGLRRSQGPLKLAKGKSASDAAQARKFCVHTIREPRDGADVPASPPARFRLSIYERRALITYIFFVPVTSTLPTHITASAGAWKSKTKIDAKMRAWIPSVAAASPSSGLRVGFEPLRAARALEIVPRACKRRLGPKPPAAVAVIRRQCSSGRLTRRWRHCPSIPTMRASLKQCRNKLRVAFPVSGFGVGLGLEQLL